MRRTGRFDNHPQGLPSVLRRWQASQEAVECGQHHRLDQGRRVTDAGHAPTLVEPVVLAALDRFLGSLPAARA